MERRIFIQDEILSLAEYMPEDDFIDYNDWLDPDTQKGYNYKFDELYAGCYSDNESSFKMLKKCGFVPHTEGNLKEKHFLTGNDITQFDFVYRKGFLNGY